MPVTNPGSGTRVDEIADGIYRISTPIPANPALPEGFTFNQYLVLDDQPLLFHTGPHRMFPLVREAMASVMPVANLRWVSFSHFEADECGALNDWLDAAPEARPLCSQTAAMLSVEDFATRPPLALGDGEEISLGQRRVRWLDTPHLPHNWEAGYLFEATTRTLLCGDILTQPGATPAPLTEGDVLGPSERMRQTMDCYSNRREAQPLLEKLAATEPTTLACMHGSAWHGDGARLLRALGDELGRAS